MASSNQTDSRFSSPTLGLSPGLRAVIQKLQRNFKFFRNLPESVVYNFLRSSQSKSFKKKENITCPIGAGDGICLLVSGQIELKAGDDQSFAIETGAVFGLIPFANGVTAIAAEDALVFFVSRARMRKEMPHVMAEFEVCPLGVRSLQHGQMCFEPKKGRYFQPLPEVVRSFCKMKNNFYSCPQYRAFLSPSG